MDANARTIEALYAVGHRLISEDRPRDAIALFRTMLLVDPRDERGWLGLATCHEMQDELEKALALCELATSTCESPARITLARARIHLRLGARFEAREAYAEAARLACESGDRELAELVAREAA